MITVLKLASLSAVLSASIVTAFDAPAPVPPGSVKLYHNRIVADADTAPARYADAAGSRVASDAASGGCGQQTWPYVSGDCVAGAPRRVVRTITVERRDELATSTLVRLPAQTIGR